MHSYANKLPIHSLCFIASHEEVWSLSIPCICYLLSYKSFKKSRYVILIWITSLYLILCQPIRLRGARWANTCSRMRRNISRSSPNVRQMPTCKFTHCWTSWMWHTWRWMRSRNYKPQAGPAQSRAEISATSIQSNVIEVLNRLEGSHSI